MTRAAIYARISKDDDRSTAKTSRQVADCEDYCDEQGWQLVEVFKDDGISAFDRRAKRPGFEALKAAILARRIDAVVVWKQDRLSRQPTQLHEFLDLLIDRKILFRSLKDPGADLETPGGQLFLTMTAGMARHESEQIRLRVKRGLQDRAAKGLPHMGGCRPFGWEADKLTINQVEAEILRDIVKRVSGGESVYQAVKDLNDQGIRSTTGKPFSTRVMMIMLRNPRLAGYRLHNGKISPISGIEPIITKQEFEALQRRLGTTSVVAGEKIIRTNGDGAWQTREVRLLGGLVICACHGVDMTRRRQQWECRFTGCAISAPWLEEFVTREALYSLAGRAIMYQDDLRKPADIEASLEALRGRLTSLTVAHYVRDEIPLGDYQTARQQLSEQIEKLEAELLAMSGMQLTLRKGKWSYEEWWDQASLPERKDALRSIITRITVSSDKTARASLKAVGYKPTKNDETVRRERVEIEWDLDSGLARQPG